MRKIILHLCADTGSDTKPYQNDPAYEVIKIGADIGVENYTPPKNVYGIVANPVCTEFSTARKGGKPRNPEQGMYLVNECLRIIKQCQQNGGLKFWVIENPARGALRHYLGAPAFTYQPYEFGSPWSKHTALWGEFNKPAKIYKHYADLPDDLKIKDFYIRPTRQYANGTIRRSSGTPSLAGQHKQIFKHIPEFKGLPVPDSDMELRSLCSQKFAKAFYLANL